MRKQLFCVLLCMCMLLACLPIPALATDGAPEATEIDTVIPGSDGDDSGGDSGDGSGSGFGDGSGDSSDSDSGSDSGTNSGNDSGDGSGSNSGDGADNDSGDSSGSNTGDGSDNDSGNSTGSGSGDGSGDGSDGGSGSGSDNDSGNSTGGGSGDDGSVSGDEPEAAADTDTCICGIKCLKDEWDDECPVCTVDPSACLGFEISLLSDEYISGGSVSYLNLGNNTVDIHGAGEKQTTYKNRGYMIKSLGLEGASIAVNPDFVNDGRYVKLAYTVTNNTGSEINGQLGVYADVQIGSNDYATISVIWNKAGQAIGLKMLEEDVNNTQFNLYFAGTGGVTNAATYWFGLYSNREANCFTQTDQTELNGTDSGLAISWNVSIPAGQSKTYSCIVGVGEAAAPPEWSDASPVALTMTADATKENLKLNVSAKVKDAAGVEDKLFYSVNGGPEAQLGDSVTGDGANEKEITGQIDLSNAPDGTYTYLFWVVNNKGATSEAVERTIQITNGKVTGDVSKPSCNGSHDYEQNWTSDANQHWHACSRIWCDEKKDIASHTWQLQNISEGLENYQCDFCLRQKAEPHIHNWQYSASDNVLKAACTAACLYHSGLSLPLTVEGGEYTGSSYAAAFAEAAKNAWTTAGLSLPTIQYVDGADQTVSAPTTVGTYTAMASISANGQTVTATKSFTITKAIVAAPTIAEKPYTGSHQYAEISNTAYYTVTSNPGGVDAGSYDVVLTLADTVNCQWAGSSTERTLQLSFRITRADNAWLTGPYIDNWIYGNSPQAPSGTARFGNVQVAYRPATGTDADYGTAVPSLAGDYKVRFTVPGTNNYTGLSTEKELTIGKRSVTVNSGIVARDKQYDGSTAAELDLSAAVISGKLEEDVLGVTATGSFADAGVGNGKPVTIYNLALTGDSKANYVLSASGNQVGTTASITKKTVTAQLTVAERPYDGSTDAVVSGAVRAEDLVSGDNISISGLTGSYATAGAGEDKLLSVDSAGAVITGGENYQVDFPATARGTVTKAPLTVTATDHSITYGDAPAANGVTYSGFVNNESEAVLGGALTYTFTYSQFDDVGNSYRITPGGLTADNYAIRFAPGTLAVTPESLTAADITATLERTAYAPTENPITPSVTVSHGDRPLTLGTDFQVDYSGNSASSTPVTAAASITGLGNYKDTIIRKFVITEALTLVPALPSTAEPDDEEAIAAYEAAQAAFDALDEQQRALLGDGVAAAYEARLDTLYTALTDYRIISGSGCRWYQGSGRTLSFTANGACRKYTVVRIDGGVINPDNYTVTAGSTIITLHNSYLQSLGGGTHTLQVVYSDGATDLATFTVMLPIHIPATGDTGNLVLFGGIMLLSLAGLLVISATLRRKTRQSRREGSGDYEKVIEKQFKSK